MSRSTFSGPVRSLAGFYAGGQGAQVDIVNGTNTITLSAATHAGRVIAISDGSLAITLPTLSSSTDDDPTSPGQAYNIGTLFRFYFSADAGTVTMTAGGTDVIFGALFLSAHASAAGQLFVSDGLDTILTFNGTTTGGISGSYFELEAVEDGTWLARGIVIASGAIVTPFS